MRRVFTISICVAALLAPQAIAQDAGATKLAECRMALRDAMQAAMKHPVINRANDPDAGTITAVLRVPGLQVVGQPSLAFNVVRATNPVSTSFVSMVALDYAGIRTALPKVYGKSRCDAEGTAITYCLMNLSDDFSMGARHRVTMSAEPAEGSGTMLTCMYEKLDS